MDRRNSVEIQAISVEEAVPLSPGAAWAGRGRTWRSRSSRSRGRRWRERRGSPGARDGARPGVAAERGESVAPGVMWRRGACRRRPEYRGPGNRPDGRTRGRHRGDDRVAAGDGLPDARRARGPVSDGEDEPATLSVNVLGPRPGHADRAARRKPLAVAVPGQPARQPAHRSTGCASSLDIEGYKRHREESLIGLAERVARQVARNGRPISWSRCRPTSAASSTSRSAMIPR